MAPNSKPAEGEIPIMTDLQQDTVSLVPRNIECKLRPPARKLYLLHIPDATLMAPSSTAYPLVATKYLQKQT